MADTTPSLPDALSSIRARFVSGNSVPVTSARITRDELDALEALLRERDELRRTALRYEWWRQNIDCLEEDGDGLAGVAFSSQIDIINREWENGELMDEIADRHIAFFAGPKPCARVKG